MYLKPAQVVSPKDKIRNIKPIVDRGEREHSLALLTWDNTNVLAIRWNGSDAHPGNPQSHGLPTWFILPDELVLPILKAMYADENLIGGEDIDKDVAKEFVSEEIKRLEGAAPKLDESQLESAIIRVITRMKVEGKI